MKTESEIKEYIKELKEKRNDMLAHPENNSTFQGMMARTVQISSINSMMASINTLYWVLGEENKEITLD